MLNGLLLIDKPQGWTSFDVVAKVRGILRKQQKDLRSQISDLREVSRIQDPRSKIKVGHTGTLDPMATGLLVIAIGKYTKKVPELTKQDKTYVAEVTLGKTSTTDDAEGALLDYRSQISDLRVVSEVSKIQDPSSKIPTGEEVAEALQAFIGTIQQVPPQFSAIKVAGQRSYAVARKGGEVKLEPRTVTIYDITGIAYNYPKLTFTTKVGSGTYIRSLARDLGEQLGTGAYLSALRRTSVGNFSINTACSVDKLDYDTIEKNILAID